MNNYLTAIVANQFQPAGLQPRLASRFESTNHVGMKANEPLESEGFEEAPRSQGVHDPETRSPQTRVFFENDSSHKASPATTPDQTDTSSSILEKVVEIHHQASESQEPLLQQAEEPLLVPPSPTTKIINNFITSKEMPTNTPSVVNNFITSAPSETSLAKAEDTQQVQVLPEQPVSNPKELVKEVHHHFQEVKEVSKVDPSQVSSKKTNEVTITPLTPNLELINPPLLQPVSPPPLPHKPEVIMAPTPPTIQVTIGRIDIRATPPKNPVQQKSKAPSGIMTLEDYLKRRRAR